VVNIVAFPAILARKHPFNKSGLFNCGMQDQLLKKM